METLRVIAGESNRQTILFVISGLAFVMSLSNWIHTWVTQRKKLRISISQYQGNVKCNLFYLAIENLSRLPIAISRIILIVDGKEYECTAVPKKAVEVVSKTGGVENSRRIYESLAMPISLTSLGSAHGYIPFEENQQVFPPPPTVVTFRVYTNRGGSILLKVPLSNKACQERIS